MFLKERLGSERDRKKILYRNELGRTSQSEIIIVDNISLENYIRAIDSLVGDKPKIVIAYTSVKDLDSTTLKGSGFTKPTILFSDGAVSVDSSNTGFDSLSTITGTYIGWSGENASISHGGTSSEILEDIEAKSAYYIQTAKGKGDIDIIIRKCGFRNINLKCIRHSSSY